jgi:hypothetical protein
MTGSLEDQRKLRAQHLVLRREREHVAAETRARFRAVTSRLAIPPSATPMVLDVLMEAARFYSMECSYANYELRTGCSYPSERRESDESQELADWARCLERLDAALAISARRPG